MGLHNEWKGFLGELLKSHKPLFMMGKSASLLPTKTLVEVYLGFLDKQRKSKLHCDYMRIEGCYANRSFIVHDNFGDVVAEVCFTLIHFSMSWISCIIRLFFEFGSTML